MRKLLVLLIPVFLTLQLNAQQNLSVLGTLTYTQGLNDIWGYVDSLGNEYALVGTQTGVSIVDVTNPSSPVEIHFISSASNTWRDLKVWNDFAYVTTEATIGLMIIDLRHLQDSVPFAYSNCGVGFTDAHNIFIDEFGVAYLFGSNGSLGTLMLDVDTDPWNPVSLGNYTANYIHDGMVKNNIMYGGEIYAGQMSVVDVTNKAAPVVLGTHSTLLSFTHAVWISGDATKAFTVDEKSAAFIESFDISNPANIQRLDAEQSNPGSGVIPHNVFNINEYLVTSYYRDGVTIHDVARPHNIIQVGNNDTYPQGSGNGFNGCWGVYPYLPSGNIIASDRSNGLIVLSPTYTRACYLEGTVTDICSGNPISNATISINGIAASDVSDIIGGYATGTVTPGTYTIDIFKAGYQSQTISGIVLSNGNVNFLNIQLTDTIVPITIDPFATIVSPSCVGDTNGSVNINVSGGYFPYTFLWTNGATEEDITKLVAGTYTVTATDSKGCEAQQSFTVVDPNVITITTSKMNVSCHGANNGSAQVAAGGGNGGPYLYSWGTTPVQTTQNISGLAGSIYSIMVTDNNGCTAEAEIEVRDPDQLVVFYIPLQSNPTGTPTGEINQLVSGGIAPYTYSWSNGESTEDIFNLIPGTYFSSVIDRRGCAVLTVIPIN